MSDLDTPDRDPAHLTPELRFAWTIIRATMESAGHPMRLVEGRRSLARQDHLYAQGRTRPGPIVTRVSSTIGTARHCPGPDGLGWALDAGFAGPEPFGEHHPWELYGATCERNGLGWGGRWARPDRPHCQLVRPAPKPVVA